MTKARNIADLLDANGDVKSASLDNVPASDDASALTTGTLPNARLPNNIVDGGTTGTRIAQGTTAQRGSTEGDVRYNTDTNSLEIRNNSEFIAVESSMSFTSISPLGISPSDNTGGGNNITLTGIGFVSGATVQFIGTDGTVFNASSVAFTNSTTLVATAPELTESKEPFDVKVINPSGNSVQLDNQIQINTTPVWQTASSTLATINDTATGTHATVSATDADGGDTVTYAESTSVLSGAGLTLNTSNGQITGDPTNVNANTTYTFGINATDGTDIVNRSFNIIVNKVLDGTTSARANTSAKAIYTLDPNVTAGVKYLTHNGTTYPIWCDFSQNSGWELIMSVNTDSPATASFYDGSSVNEIQAGDTSPQARDVKSQFRINRPWRYIMIKYEDTNFSPNNLYYNAPPIYDGGSTSSTGVTQKSAIVINRLSGNNGILPLSSCGANGTYYADRLYLNTNATGARNVRLGNFSNDGQNQAGFFYSSPGYQYATNFDGGCNTGNQTKFEMYIRE